MKKIVSLIMICLSLFLYFPVFGDNRIVTANAYDEALVFSASASSPFFMYGFSQDGPFCGGSYHQDGTARIAIEENQCHFYNSLKFSPLGSPGYGYKRLKSNLFNQGFLGGRAGATIDFILRFEELPVISDMNDPKVGQTGFIINTRFSQVNKELYLSIAKNSDGDFIATSYSGDRNNLNNRDLTVKELPIYSDLDKKNYHRYTITYNPNLNGDKVILYIDGTETASFPDLSERTQTVPLNKDFIYFSAVNRNILNNGVIDAYLGYIKVYNRAVPVTRLSSNTASLISVYNEDRDHSAFDDRIKDLLTGMEFLPEKIELFDEPGYQNDWIISKVHNSTVSQIASHGFENGVGIWNDLEGNLGGDLTYDVVLSLQDNYFSNTKLLIFTGCCTASGDNSIVDAFRLRGVDCVGGFSVISFNPKNKRFASMVFDELAEGATVSEAVSAAQDKFKDIYGENVANNWIDEFYLRGSPHTRLV